MTADLRSLLQQAGVEPPYLPAGHSLGGLIAQRYAGLYPAEVAAVVLIDSSHPGQAAEVAAVALIGSSLPGQASRLPRTSVRDYPGGKLLDAARTWAKPLGVRRAARDLGLRQVSTEDLAASHRRAILGERLVFPRVMREAGSWVVTWAGTWARRR